MSLWKNDQPPVLYPNAVATPSGWTDPATGELLVTVIGLSTYKGGAAELHRVSIVGNKKIFAHNDYIVLEVSFTEAVTVTGTPTIDATINGNARQFTYFVDSSEPNNGTGFNRIRFRYQVANNETATANQIVFTSPITGVFTDAEINQGSGAAGTAVTTSGVVSVSVGAGGSGYTSAPDVVFSGGGATTQATGTAVLDKQVASIAVTNGGSGYTSAPTVGFTGGSGTGATATATLAASGSIKSVTVGGSGIGYTNGDTVTFTGGGGTGAAATLVTSSGNVTSVTITNGGSGYTSAPTVTITSGTGTGNTFTAVVGKAVASIAVTGGGTGFTSAPTVTFSGGNGTGAAATATMSNRDAVLSVTVNTPGVGYTGNPTVTFENGGGTGATATATRSTVVSGVTITAGGTAYWEAPTVGFSGGGGTGAAGTAVVDRGVVKSITMTNYGTGYSSPPSVAFTNDSTGKTHTNPAFTTSGISTGFSIDGVHPTISGVTLSGESVTNHFYTNDAFTLTVTGTKALYVNTAAGTPYITVTINSVARRAYYRQGNGSTVLKFIYEILPADTAIAGQVSITSPIVLNSGTITDYQGNSLTLTFSAPTVSSHLVN